MKYLYSFALFVCTIQANAQNNPLRANRELIGRMNYNVFSTVTDASVVRDIDNYILKGLDTVGQSGPDQIYIYSQAMDFTLIRIRREYHSLYRRLNTVDKQLLRATQQQWQVYFSSEQTTLNSLFGSHNYGQGSGHNEARAQWLFQIARQRLITLRTFNGQLP